MRYRIYYSVEYVIHKNIFSKSMIKQLLKSPGKIINSLLIAPGYKQEEYNKCLELLDTPNCG